MESGQKKVVGACDTQPIAVEGLRAVLEATGEFVFLRAANSLPRGLELALHQKPDLMVVDKAFGLQALHEWIEALRRERPQVALIVWGTGMTEAEAVRLVQAGARGVVRKSAEITTLLTCLRAVSAGATWMEDSLFRENGKNSMYQRSHLTAREQQVMELVEQGLKNKEIAGELGIRPGTVKIHLKHIFEKTGVRGRYGLALTGLKEKGLLTLPD